MSENRIKTALTISFFVSFLSLGIKIAATVLTDATTALSDAAESVVHVFAVGFVLFGYYLSLKPADENHLYGHERIEFLSVGVEGTVIILAAITIVFHAMRNALFGFELHNLGTGITLMALAAGINFVLGLYVQRTGYKENNMMAVSNGKHILTDVWTSGGVILTLFLITLTGWVYLDTIVSMAVAAYISYEGYKLIRYSVMGLMDTRDPEIHKALLKVLEGRLPGSAVNWHQLRHRTSGTTTWVELHLEFKPGVEIKQAHDDATLLERKLIDALKGDAVVTIHLEPEGHHEKIHGILKGANKNRPLDDFI